MVRTFNNKGIIGAIERLTAINEISHIVVAVNTDFENRGEKDGAFTKRLINSASGLKSNPKVVIHPVANWGKNVGSAAALNDAVTEIFYRLGRLPTERDIIFSVSVESWIKAGYIREALKFFETHDDLAVIGIKRKIIIGDDKESKALEAKFQKTVLQYRIPQNTMALWRADLLRLAGSFRTECDFSGLTEKIDGQQVPVAGMDDFPTLLFLVRLGYRWAIIGKKNPVVWDLSEVKKDPQRWQMNLNKMNRQEKVIGIWAQKFHCLSIREAVEILKRGQLNL